MPHLSPLSWMFASLLFWFILILFISSIWWYQLPSFKKSSNLSHMSFSPWIWN
uniref:ATP synthase F0 subunit 8 n=1 Tax=Micronephthys minuta TaxID=1037237 RepID=UPI0030DE8B82